VSYLLSSSRERERRREREKWKKGENRVFAHEEWCN